MVAVDAGLSYERTLGLQFHDAIEELASPVVPEGSCIERDGVIQGEIRNSLHCSFLLGVTGALAPGTWWSTAL